VDVISHQTIPENRKLKALAVVAQQSHVHLAISRAKEHVSPSIAALCDVMRLTHGYDPANTRHISFILLGFRQKFSSISGLR
jgi:hypothetical protein